MPAAAWATIHPAWIGDDEGAVFVAAACRLQAESLVREAEAKGLIVIQPPGRSVALRSDLLRRAGAFSEAMSIIDAALAEVTEFSDPLLRNLLQSILPTFRIIFLRHRTSTSFHSPRQGI